MDGVEVGCEVRPAKPTAATARRATTSNTRDLGDSFFKPSSPSVAKTQVNYNAGLQRWEIVFAAQRSQFNAAAFEE
jgi:hypothetical protein